MNKSDWLEIGLKLLGVYFLVVGFVSLWRIILSLMFAAGHGIADASAGAISCLFPLGELMAGYVLISLRWEVAQRSQGGVGLPVYMPDYLKESLTGMEEGRGPAPFEDTDSSRGPEDSSPP